MLLYYEKAIKEFIKLNRLNIQEFTGYSINAKTNTIIVYFPHKRFKINCSALNQFIRILEL